MRPYTARSAMLAALIEGQRKRLRNEAIWRQEELLPMSSIEPADPAPPRVATVQPRPEPQLNLPHLGDIWERMQEEKRSLGALNLNRTGLVVKTGVFGPQGTPLPGAPGVGFGGQPGDDSGADGAASPSIDPGFVVDHQTFAQSIGDGWLTPDELAQVHGVANGVNAYRLGRQSGPIGGEAHQAAAADLSQAADRLASSNRAWRRRCGLTARCMTGRHGGIGAARRRVAHKAAHCRVRSTGPINSGARRRRQLMDMTLIPSAPCHRLCLASSRPRRLVRSGR